MRSQCRQCITKMLVILRRWAGWSAPLLFAVCMNRFFTWHSSILVIGEKSISLWKEGCILVCSLYISVKFVEKTWLKKWHSCSNKVSEVLIVYHSNNSCNLKVRKETVKQIWEDIWWWFKDNFAYFSIKTYVVGTHRGDSNEYPQQMLLWRNNENYP